MQLDLEPDWRYLDKIITNIKNIDKKSVYDCIKEVYEATFTRYGILFHEQKLVAQRAESAVIAKYGVIDRLEKELKKAYALLDEHKIKIPERVSIPVKGFAPFKSDSEFVVLQEGSPVTEGFAGYPHLLSRQNDSVGTEEVSKGSE